MPHVIVKMLPGRSDEQKRSLADAVTKAVIATAECGEDAVSVAIEDVFFGDWTAKVYRPDIEAKPQTIFKQPGYAPF